jgi:hypothetical protein
VDHDALVGLSRTRVGTGEDDRARQLDDEVAVGFSLIGDRFRTLREGPGSRLRRCRRGNRRNERKDDRQNEERRRAA